MANAKGRPRMYEEGTIKNIIFKIDENKHYLFKNKCTQNKTNMSEVINAFIDEYLNA